MATRKRKTTGKAAKPLSDEHKKKFNDQLDAAEKSVKALQATVDTLRQTALAASYVGGKPMRSWKRPKRY